MNFYKSELKSKFICENVINYIRKQLLKPILPIYNQFGVVQTYTKSIHTNVINLLKNKNCKTKYLMCLNAILDKSIDYRLVV